MALMNDGTVKSWGYNESGKLGLGDTDNRTTPTTVNNLSNVKSLAAGNNHSLALMNDGTVKAWGANYYGQLGLGDNSNRSIPTTIPSLGNVKQIVAGEYCSLAVLDNGTVKAWGWNISGQLGLGYSDGNNICTPTTISGLTDVKRIFHRNSSTFVLLNDGTVKAWGSNSKSVLGIDTNGSLLLTPTVIPGLFGAKQISIGRFYTVALLDGGTVKTWGMNNTYQLGLGDSDDRNAPTTVQGLIGVNLLEAGATHSIALMNDGTVKAWGSSYEGALGIGLNWAASPTTIPNLTYDILPVISTISPSQNGTLFQNLQMSKRGV